MASNAEPEVLRLQFKKSSFTGAVIAGALVAGLTDMLFLVHPSVPLFWRVATGLLFAVALLAVGGWIWRRGWNADAAAITLTTDALLLPPVPFLTRIVRVPLGEIRSVTLRGRGRQRVVSIDTETRHFQYPCFFLEDMDAAGRLQPALRSAFLQTPETSALWPAIEARHALADTLADIAPFGTRFLLLTIIVLYGFQLFAYARPHDTVTLLGLGANAGALVLQGEWYRLVVANMVQATPLQLAVSLCALAFIGPRVERLIGLRHVLIVFLLSCLASQLAMALLMPSFGDDTLGTGCIGGIFGLAGVLLPICIRFDAVLPGEYRFVRKGRYNFGFPFFFLFAMRLLRFSGLAGLVAGLAGGFLLSRNTAEPAALREPRTLTNDVFAAMLIVFAIGIAAGAMHGGGRDTCDNDLWLMAHGIARNRNVAAVARTRVASDIANLADASPALLHEAGILAEQAATALRRDGRQSAAFNNAADTQAVIDDRLGYPAAAAEIEEVLPWGNQPFADHFASFLQNLMRNDGADVLGDAGPAVPKIVLAHGVINVEQAAPLPKGGLVYAVLSRDEKPAGLLMVMLPPGFTGTQLLPLPTAFSSPSTNPPPPLWLDGKTILRPALFDRRGCFCNGRPQMGPWFIATAPEQVALR